MWSWWLSLIIWVIEDTFLFLGKAKIKGAAGWGHQAVLGREDDSREVYTLHQPPSKGHARCHPGWWSSIGTLIILACGVGPTDEYDWLWVGFSESYQPSKLILLLYLNEMNSIILTLLTPTSYNHFFITDKH